MSEIICTENVVHSCKKECKEEIFGSVHYQDKLLLYEWIPFAYRQESHSKNQIRNNPSNS